MPAPANARHPHALTIHAALQVTAATECGEEATGDTADERPPVHHSIT
jgi:hypothetical protein